jgi:hypothetical protein
MRLSSRGLLVAVLIAASIAAVPQQRHRLTVPKGTDVILVFDAPVSSRTAHIGDTIPMHVRDDVVVRGVTVLDSGTAVDATISSVSKRIPFGGSATLRIDIDPVETPYGDRIVVAPVSKGKDIGKRTGDAAAISAGGAVLLGPIGWIGGLFVKGKSVDIKAGDELVTEVTRNAVITYQ